MIFIVTTKSGTKYKIDDTARKWARISKTDLSGPLRTEEGSFFEVDGMKVGRRMNIYGQGLEFGTRVISTTPVVSVEVE